jgi:hypothetical protein
MFSGGGIVQDEDYPYRRLLGAVLLEALDDALNLRGNVGMRDRRDALEFLRDGSVQYLYNTSLSLPPRLWKAFVGVPAEDLGVNYAVVTRWELLLERHASQNGVAHKPGGVSTQCDSVSGDVGSQNGRDTSRFPNLARFLRQVAGETH